MRSQPEASGILVTATDQQNTRLQFIEALIFLAIEGSFFIIVVSNLLKSIDWFLYSDKLERQGDPDLAAALS